MSAGRIQGDLLIQVQEAVNTYALENYPALQNNLPVVKNGAIVPGQRLMITISADHRVTDGAEAARFLQAVKKYLEEPLRLLL